MLQGQLVVFFVALEEDGLTGFLGKRLVDSENGGLDEGELFEFGGGLLEGGMDRTSTLALLPFGDNSFPQHGFGLLMVLLDVSVEGGVGEVGLAAGTVEISAD